MSDVAPIPSAYPLPVLLEHYYYDVTGEVVHVSDFTSIGDGWETEVYSFTLTHGDQVDHLILRMYPGDNAVEKCAHEYEGIDMLWQEGYSVPQVFELEADRDSLGMPFIIMQKIDGQPFGAVMRENPTRQAELITYLAQLMVDLHRLDYHVQQEYVNSLELEIDPGFVPPPDLVPSDLLRRKFDEGRSMMVDRFQQAWTIPVFDWLEARLPDVLKTASLSIIHHDFHPYNIMLTPENQAYVIDWSLIEVADYRFDLGWTMILSARHSLAQRDLILSEYERFAGHPVEHIEYFEVVGVLRRLFDLSASLTSGADALGMRPDAVEIMRRQHDHYQQVYDVLCKYTGLRLPEIEQLLDTLKE